jgi:hypothetical protein
MEVSVGMMMPLSEWGMAMSEKLGCMSRLGYNPDSS